MRKKPLYLVALALVVFPFSGYAQPPDVHGWQKARWGMTPSQLANAYGTQLTIKKADSGRVLYLIGNYNVFNNAFSVSFNWHNHEYLDDISISNFPQMTFSRSSKKGLEEKIRAALTSMYGTGKIIKKSHQDASGSGPRFSGESTDTVIQWTFPSTLITFTFSEVELVPHRFGSSIQIDYQESGSDSHRANTSADLCDGPCLQVYLLRKSQSPFPL